MSIIAGKRQDTPTSIPDEKVGDVRVSEHGDLIVVGQGKRVQDTFTRPANTTAYAAGDVISGTVSDTDTTVLRSLNLGWRNGRVSWLTFLRLETNLTTFLTKTRLHLYTVAAPTTAVAGDNTAYARVYANKAFYIGVIEIPILTLWRAGDDLVSATVVLNSIDGQLPFLIPPTTGTTLVYYRLVVLEGTPTPASGQSFTLTAHVVDN